MIEEPKSLAIAKRIYDEANIERNFVVSLNKIYFNVVTDPSLLNPFDVEFTIADHMFDSSFLESEVTAYLMASDPELASWNRQHHLNYLEDEIKYFIVAEEFCSGDESVTFDQLIKAKTIEDAEQRFANCYDGVDKNDITNDRTTAHGNMYRVIALREIPKAHFDILAKYLTVI